MAEMLADIAGVIGLFLSILVFALTRWERRRKLLIHLETGHLKQFQDELDEAEGLEPVVVAHVVNIGGVPIILDKESVLFCGNGWQFHRGSGEWLGLDQLPIPLSPLASCRLGLFSDAFEQVAQSACGSTSRTEKERRQNQWTTTFIVKDVNGRSYSSEISYKYNVEVGEFVAD